MDAGSVHGLGDRRYGQSEWKFFAFVYLYKLQVTRSGRGTHHGVNLSDVQAF